MWNVFSAFDPSHERAVSSSSATLCNHWEFLMLSVKQGGIGFYFYSLWYDPGTCQGIEPTTSQSQGTHSLGHWGGSLNHPQSLHPQYLTSASASVLHLVGRVRCSQLKPETWKSSALPLTYPCFSPGDQWELASCTFRSKCISSLDSILGYHCLFTVLIGQQLR